MNPDVGSCMLSLVLGWITVMLKLSGFFLIPRAGYFLTRQKITQLMTRERVVGTSSHSFCEGRDSCTETPTLRVPCMGKLRIIRVSTPGIAIQFWVDTLHLGTGTCGAVRQGLLSYATVFSTPQSLKFDLRLQLRARRGFPGSPPPPTTASQRLVLIRQAFRSRQ